MIFASDFLKWCEVFGIVTGGVLPPSVTLQAAYDNSSPKQIDISAGNLNFINGTFGINAVTVNPNSSFQVDSTTQGTIPAPRMTNAQLDALFTTLTTSDNALMVYDTDHETYNYWEGTEKKEILAIENVIAGANMNVINNDDGTVTLAATSGPAAVDAGQANFYISNNAMDTVFSGIGVPAPILSDTISLIYQNNFSVTLESDTPNVQFLTSATRNCLIGACLTLRTSSVLTQTFSLYINIDHGGSSTLTSKLGTVTLDPSGTPGPQIISTIANLPITGPNDSIQFYLSNDSATTDPVLVLNATVAILDTTQFGAFSSTDVLPQGVNNLYLSTDGGASFQNTSGLITSGHIARFLDSSGILVDSGYNLTEFVKQGDSNIYFGAPPSSPFEAPRMLNLHGMDNTPSNSLNFYTSATNYPLFQISPTQHNNISLNFDCYYDGVGLKSSSTGINYQIQKTSGSLAILYGNASAGNVPTMTKAIDIDGTGMVTILGSQGLNTLRLGTSSASLPSVTPAMTFATNYSNGNLINFELSGRNIGVNNNLFMSYNIDYNSIIPGYMINSNGNAFVFELASSGMFFKVQNGGTAGGVAALNTAISINQNGLITLPQLAAGSRLLAVDSGKNIETATGYYTLSGLTLNNGGSQLLGIVADLIFDPVLADGDYINLGGSGRNIGVTNGGSVFLSYNLDYDPSVPTYKFNSNGNAFTLEMDGGGFYIKSSTSGSAGSSISPTTRLSITPAGGVDIPFIADNNLVARVTGTLNSAAGGSFSLGQLMLNSVAAPTLTQAGRLNSVGQNTTTDNAINLYTHTDGYPLVNIVSPVHGTQYVNFDCYFDGTDFRSSYSSGSNFQFVKASNVFSLNCAGSVAQGGVISFANAWTADTSGNFQVDQVSASSLVVTDSSGNFRSASNLIITSEVTITGSTQSASNGFRYYVNYAGGQCAITLPAATAGGAPIEIIGLSTSSTSGFSATAVGSDVIQFGASVSAAAGNIVSTTGSATDAITLHPIAGRWVVYPALGLNLVVT